jgi:two-component system, sensor histidine kinase YesM
MMRSKSLRTSMFFLYVTSICIPFLVITVIYSYYFSKQILNSNKTSVSNTLESISSGIGIYVAELNSISNVPYFISDVMDTMKDINSLKHKNVPSTAEDLKNSKNFRLVFLKYIYNSTQHISDVTFLPEYNEKNLSYIMSRNANETVIKTDDDYKNQDWYNYLQENKKKSIFFAVYKNAGEEGNNKKEITQFSFAKIIRDVDTKKNIGILKIDIDSKKITKLIQQVELTSQSMLAIATEDGEIIYTKSKDERLLDLSNINQLSDSTLLKYQVIKKPIENTSLQLIYLSSTSEILYYQTITYMIVFLLTLVAVLASFVIYRFKTNKIAKSVSDIKDTFKKIETGDLTAKCTVSNQKEFIEISHALNHMTETLNEYIIKEYKANLSQQEAEYRALQAQINPHFLYNTLNGFIALNRMGEKRLLEKSIIQLTQLFQYTCNNSTVTTIESELSFIRKYLELQTLKYDERLSFSIYIEPDTKDIIIPKLLLQPLIENSVIHGMEPNDTPMYIQIETGLLNSTNFGDYLFIHIKDNGGGFDQTKLQFLENIGLKNIENRLKYHSPWNVFQIRSRIGVGTECIILFSLMPKAQKGGSYENITG